MSVVKASVLTTIGNCEIISALRSLTIDREEFDPGPWSIHDAETLERIASAIRREIGEAATKRLHGKD